MKHSISISEVKIKERFRKDIDDLESLKNDIAKQSLLQPIVIDTNKVLVAGLRRLKSCEELGWKNIPCTMIDLKNLDPRSCEISENTERKNFTISEIISIAEYVKKTRIGHRPKKDVKLTPFQTKYELIINQKKGAKLALLSHRKDK